MAFPQIPYAYAWSEDQVAQHLSAWLWTSCRPSEEAPTVRNWGLLLAAVWSTGPVCQACWYASSTLEDGISLTNPTPRTVSLYPPPWTTGEVMWMMKDEMQLSGR